MLADDTALEGIRVIELAHGIAGPYCGKLLADAGADVVKIEAPGGDPARTFGPFPGGVKDPERSGLFLFLNTSKRSIVLDLTNDEDRATTRELIGRADVVIESGTPGALEQLDLGYRTLERDNPGLVLTSITAFGQTGPDRDRRANELVLNAAAGLTYLNGAYNREPVTLGLHQGQLRAGQYAAVATLAALWERRRSGRGQEIDLSMAECITTGLMNRLAEYYYRGAVLRRQPRDGAGLSDAQPLRARDGHVVPGLSLPPFGSWDELVDFLDDERLRDARFATVKGRNAHADEINACLEEAFRQRRRYELFHAAQSHRFPFGVVQDAADLLGCPQLNARGFFVDVEHPVAGTLRYPGPPYRSTVTTPGPRSAAPLLDPQAGERRAVTWPSRERAPRDADVPRKPLEGVKVLEAAIQVSMPTAGKLLAALGADVIKVEGCARPCGLRFGGPYPDNEPGDRPWDRSGYFNEVNSGKRSLTLDLSTADGQRIFKDLVRDTDVVTENFTPRVMRKFGLDHAALSRIKPDLVMISCTGFGHSGPWRDYVAYGMNIETLVGAASVTGYEGGPPMRGGTAYIDDIVALHATFAILAGLHHRERTGEGQWIDIAMYEAGFLTPEAVFDQQMNGTICKRIGNGHLTEAPHGLYRCAGEDRWVAIAVRSDPEWKAFAQVLGVEGDTARYATAEQRVRHRKEVDELVTAWTAGRSGHEIVAALCGIGIATAEAMTNVDVLTDPHLLTRGFFETLDHGDTGPHATGRRPYPGLPWRFSRSPQGFDRAAPGLGQHSAEILRERLGIPAAEIDRLRKEAVIGDAPVGRALQPPRQTDLEELRQQGRIVRYDHDYRARLGI